MYGGVHMGFIYDVQLKQASKVTKLSLAEYIMFNEKIFRLQRCATYHTNSKAKGMSKYHANEPPGLIPILFNR